MANIFLTAVWVPLSNSWIVFEMETIPSFSDNIFRNCGISPSTASCSVPGTGKGSTLQCNLQWLWGCCPAPLGAALQSSWALVTLLSERQSHQSNLIILSVVGWHLDNTEILQRATEATLNINDLSISRRKKNKNPWTVKPGQLSYEESSFPIQGFFVQNVDAFFPKCCPVDFLLYS